MHHQACYIPLVQTATKGLFETSSYAELQINRAAIGGHAQEVASELETWGK